MTTIDDKLNYLVDNIGSGGGGVTVNVETVQLAVQSSYYASKTWQLSIPKDTKLSIITVEATRHTMQTVANISDATISNGSIVGLYNNRISEGTGYSYLRQWAIRDCKQGSILTIPISNANETFITISFIL